VESGSICPLPHTPSCCSAQAQGRILLERLSSYILGKIPSSELGRLPNSEFGLVPNSELERLSSPERGRAHSSEPRCQSSSQLGRICNFDLKCLPGLKKSYLVVNWGLNLALNWSMELILGKPRYLPRLRIATSELKYSWSPLLEQKRSQQEEEDGYISHLLTQCR
jgi:hypothetical protein